MKYTSLVIAGLFIGGIPRLNVTSFRGKPPGNAAYLATTSCNVFFNISEMQVVNKQLVRFKKVNTWVRLNDESWIQLNKISRQSTLDSLLNHEQGHLNLFYLQAEELRKSLLAKKFDVTRIKPQADSISSGLFAKFDSLQKKYDLETDHMNKPVKQKEWDAKIKTLIERAF